MTASDAPKLHVWDAQTGAIINETQIWGLGEIAFSGNRKVVHFLEGGYCFYVYDALDGTQLNKGRLSRWSSHQLGAHWAQEDLLSFATSFETDGKLVVNIQELRLTSSASYPAAKLFHVPPHGGTFSFSPASFHASFVTETEIVVLDVRRSKILLRVKATRQPYTPPGHFSPDGRFFACGTREPRICVWKNMANYVPWSSLKPRLPFKEFSFSPATSSILTWDQQGIQLLHIGSHPTPTSPGGNEPNRQRGDYLVAYSADWAHITTARREDGVITALGPRSSTWRGSIDTGVGIRDMKIVRSHALVTDGNRLVRWDLGAGEVTSEAFITSGAESAALSNDCSKIAFTRSGTAIYLYDVKARAIVWGYEADRRVLDIRFPHNQRTLWLHTHTSHPSNGPNYAEEWEIAEGGSLRCVQRRSLADAWSWDNLFSGGYRIESQSGEWVVDLAGNKLLWLPPNWRTNRLGDVRWNGDSLVLVGGHRPEPTIIRFHGP